MDFCEKHPEDPGPLLPQIDQDRQSNQRMNGRSYPPALQRLISNTLTMDERVSMITTIFSDRNQVETLRDLSGDDAQVFIDIIDTVGLCIFPSLKTSKLTFIRTYALYLLGLG